MSTSHISDKICLAETFDASVVRTVKSVNVKWWRMLLLNWGISPKSIKCNLDIPSSLAHSRYAVFIYMIQRAEIQVTYLNFNFSIN